MRLSNKAASQVVRGRLVKLPKRDVELRTAEGVMPTRAATGRTTGTATTGATSGDLLAALLPDLRTSPGGRA
jgi:hypothetical protein